MQYHNEMWAGPKGDDRNQGRIRGQMLTILYVIGLGRDFVSFYVTISMRYAPAAKIYVLLWRKVYSSNYGHKFLQQNSSQNNR